jgi:hypothetical protein
MRALAKTALTRQAGPASAQERRPRVATPRQPRQRDREGPPGKPCSSSPCFRWFLDLVPRVVLVRFLPVLTTAFFQTRAAVARSPEGSTASYGGEGSGLGQADPWAEKGWSLRRVLSHKESYNHFHAQPRKRARQVQSLHVFSSLLADYLFACL